MNLQIDVGCELNELMDLQMLSPCSPISQRVDNDFGSNSNSHREEIIHELNYISPSKLKHSGFKWNDKK